MKKESIKEYIQEILKKWDKDRLKILFTPYRDWEVLLIIFFTSLIFLVIVNVYLFIYYNNSENFVKITEDEEKVETMNVKELERMIDIFKNKENNFSKFLKEKPDIVDPSF